MSLYFLRLECPRLPFGSFADIRLIGWTGSLDLRQICGDRPTRFLLLDICHQSDSVPGLDSRKMPNDLLQLLSSKVREIVSFSSAAFPFCCGRWTARHLFLSCFHCLNSFSSVAYSVYRQNSVFSLDCQGLFCYFSIIFIGVTPGQVADDYVGAWLNVRDWAYHRQLKHYARPTPCSVSRSICCRSDHGQSVCYWHMQQVSH